MICIICQNMHRHEYAEICKKKYAEICKKYANICICPMSLPRLHIYAKICKKYAKYVSTKCMICTSHFADGIIRLYFPGYPAIYVLIRYVTGHLPWIVPPCNRVSLPYQWQHWYRPPRSPRSQRHTGSRPADTLQSWVLVTALPGAKQGYNKVGQTTG